MNNCNTLTPRKTIKPDCTLFDSAIKESNIVASTPLSNTPHTPSKSAKTKHLMNIATPKCALTPTRGIKSSPLETTELNGTYFRVLPSSLFMDFPSLPSDLEQAAYWLENNIRVLSFIGDGAFSKVYAVEHLLTGTHYALKKISLKNSSSASVGSFRREVVNLWKIKGCSHCLQIYLGWEDGNSLNILTDLYRLSLSDLLQSSSHVLSKGLVLGILLDICQGLAEMHSHFILHLDLKPENIFLSLDNHAIIGDFGMSRNMHATDANFDCEGDRRFLDPLILSGVYTEYSDIYSLGLIGLLLLESIQGLGPSLAGLEFLFRKCCLHNFMQRPTIDDIKTEIQNLLKIT